MTPEEQELLREQIIKIKAESRKCELETKEIEDRIGIPWYHRAHILQAIVAGLVAVPLFWFYAKEVAIPIYMAENVRLSLENETTKAELNQKDEQLKKAEKEFKEKEGKFAADYARREEDLSISLDNYKRLLEDLKKKYSELEGKYKYLAENQPEEQAYTDLAGYAKEQVMQLQSDIMQAGRESDLVDARIGSIISGVGSNDTNSTHGFIWIGDYDTTKNRWTVTRLEGINKLKPEQIESGSTYAVSGNMTLRDKLPSDDEIYFRGAKALSFLPKGTVVTIIDSPKAFNRPTKTQYWVEVQKSR